MQLLSPLGLILFSLTGLVIAFHALRPRYMQRSVPSLRLWQQVSEALSLHARWRKVVRSILLFLHLLLVALLALAIAQPVWITIGSSKLKVHIVDGSASMLTEDVVPNRFAVAVQQAADAVRSESGPWLVIQASGSPRVVYQGSLANEAVAALTSLQPSLERTDWQGVADLLAALEEPPASIVLWTDGVVDPNEFALLSQATDDSLAVELVGTDAPVNVGIAAFDARRSGEDPNRYEVLLSVRNFSLTTSQGTVRVEAEGNELIGEEFSLTGGQERSYVFSAILDRAQTLVAHLDVDDHFPGDNAAQLVVRHPETTRVAIVGPGNRYLEDGLRIFPQLDFDLRLLISANDRYHLRIYDQLPADTHPGTRLVFAPPTSAPAAGDPVIIWWDPVHPLTRYIDWGSLAIERAVPLPVTDATRVLVESSAGPLLTVTETPSGGLIQVGFAVEESDLPRRVAFPIFLDNVLRFAHPTGWERIEPAVLPPLSEAALERTIEPTQPEQKTAEPVVVLRALWIPLVILAIILLFIEAWLFQHRTGRAVARNPGRSSARRSKGGVRG